MAKGGGRGRVLHPRHISFFSLGGKKQAASREGVEDNEVANYFTALPASPKQTRHRMFISQQSDPPSALHVLLELFV